MRARDIAYVYMPAFFHPGSAGSEGYDPNLPARHHGSARAGRRKRWKGSGRIDSFGLLIMLASYLIIVLHGAVLP